MSKLELTDDQDTLQFDLTSAYPVKTLKQLTRTFVFQRSTGSLTVTDEVTFDAPEAFGTAVITFGAWKQVSADRLLVGEGTSAVQIQIDAGGLPVKIEATTIDEDVRGRETADPNRHRPGRTSQRGHLAADDPAGGWTAISSRQLAC